MSESDYEDHPAVKANATWMRNRIAALEAELAEARAGVNAAIDAVRMAAEIELREAIGNLLGQVLGSALEQGGQQR